jgi:hypothetical protein
MGANSLPLQSTSRPARKVVRVPPGKIVKAQVLLSAFVVAEYGSVQLNRWGFRTIVIAVPG